MRGRDAAVRRIASLLVLCIVGLGCGSNVPGEPSANASATSTVPHFATAEAATRALTAALASRDGAAARALIEPASRDAFDRERRILEAASVEQVLLEDLGSGCVRLRFGFVGVPLSLPLVRDDAGWRFASLALLPSCAIAPSR